MKKIILSTLFALSIPFYADAANHKVIVQCDLAGPAYEGELRADMEFKNWAPAGECQRLGGVWQRILNVPEWSLKFNKIEYISRNAVIEVSFGSNNCDPDTSLGMDGPFELRTSSNYSAFVPSMNLHGGRFPNSFRIETMRDTNSCQVQVIN